MPMVWNGNSSALFLSVIRCTSSTDTNSKPCSGKLRLVSMYGWTVVTFKKRMDLVEETGRKKAEEFVRVKVDIS